MARKVIIDCDPGLDDAMALCMALFDPRLDVLAVTAVGGNCSPAQATRNVQAIIEQLDPPRWPRLGTASAPDDGLPVDGRYLHGSDGLGDSDFEVAELHHPHPSEKLICDEIRAQPEGVVTILALGPLTNVARAFARDPELPSLVGQVVMMGGAVAGPGNITPTAEFNMYCDPNAAQAIFRSHSTKTLVPLDVTNRVVLSYDLFNRLPDELSKVGRFLRKILPPAFRGYRQQFGLEGIHVHDAVALVAVTQPELFTTEEMAGDVEVTGELTTGATVFDRRGVPAWRNNMDVAVDMRTDAVIETIIQGLNDAARREG
ncbi:MAG: nucleoside hydrolase [Candidatus Nealsonbacteria bacterium]|nr:nucleoside hydrolase [Candidatus Nealsonbacteria bacterium]